VIQDLVLYTATIETAHKNITSRRERNNNKRSLRVVRLTGRAPTFEQTTLDLLDVQHFEFLFSGRVGPGFLEFVFHVYSSIALA
jgi:hypothetical protein